MALRRRPFFSTAVVVLLVLGFGVGGAVTALLRGIYVEPLPAVVEPEDALAVYRTYLSEDGSDYSGHHAFSYPDFLDVKKASTTFEILAAHRQFPVVLSTGDSAETVDAVFATADYFLALGVQPAAGRFFRPEEADLAGGADVAVLSYETWQRYFAGDPSVLGKTVEVNGRSQEVIGVAPKQFLGLNVLRPAELWIPAGLFPQLMAYGELFEMRDSALFEVVGRLREGVPREAASQEMIALARRLEALYPNANEGISSRVVPLTDSIVAPRDQEQVERYSRTLVLATALIVLVAGLNLAHVIFVHGLDRRRDLAMMVALGARRPQVARRLLLEIGLLFLLGGVLGFLAAKGTVHLLLGLWPADFRPSSPSMNDDLLMFATIGVTAGAFSLLCGWLPVQSVLRSSLMTTVRSFSSQASGIRSLTSLPAWLVVGQIGLSLIALIAATAALGVLNEVRGLDLGFDVENLAVGTLPLNLRTAEPGLPDQLQQAVEERIGSLPGVESVALAENRLFRGASIRRQVYLTGSEEPTVSPMGGVHRVSGVGPNFFATAGIPVLRGREITAEDCPDCPQRVVINQTMAEALWPSGHAVGERFHFNEAGGPVVEVVGVVQDSIYRSVKEPPQFFIFVPLSQIDPTSVTLHVRTRSDPETVLRPMRNEIRRLAPNLPLIDAGTLLRFVEAELWQERATAVLLTLLSAVALTLTAVGFYSLVTFLVVSQRKELAIHMALGLPPLGALVLLGRRLLPLLAAGITAGLLTSMFLLPPWMTSRLETPETMGNVSYAASIAVILVALLLACLPSMIRVLRLPVNDLLQQDTTHW